MTDPEKPKNLFEHEAFEYKAFKMRELDVKATWLPYYERLMLVAWLYGVGIVAQNVIDMPLSRFQRLVVISLGVWGALIGMGIALRRAHYRQALSYQERTRRRWQTTVATTLGMLIWVGVLYLIFGQ